MELTAEHLRAGRALLRWEQKTLAQNAGVSTQTVIRLEGQTGPVKANALTIDALVRAFEAAGIEFQNGGAPGVRLVGAG